VLPHACDDQPYKYSPGSSPSTPAVIWHQNEANNAVATPSPQEATDRVDTSGVTPSAVIPRAQHPQLQLPVVLPSDPEHHIAAWGMEDSVKDDEPMWQRRATKRHEANAGFKAENCYTASNRHGPVGRPLTPDPLSRTLSKRDWEKAAVTWRAAHRTRAIDFGVFPAPPVEHQVPATVLVRGNRKTMNAGKYSHVQPLA
jgi:hypothetical protein